MVTKSSLVLVLALAGAGCTFSVNLDTGDYPPCGPEGQCREGCLCLAGQVCVPGQQGMDAAACGECRADSDCNFGCQCEKGLCVPPVDTDYADYCLTGPQCSGAGDCNFGCSCQDYQCRPPVPTSYPDYCTLGPPECDDYQPCQFDCRCEEFRCRPPSDDAYPEYCQHGPQCTADTDCLHGCLCLGFRCLPPEPNPYPDYCQNGPPECYTDGDCRFGCYCHEFTCLPPVQTDYPDYCTQGPPECERDLECNFGCRCENFACVPRTSYGGRDCQADQAACSERRDCRLGCVCVNDVCQPLDGYGLDPSYCLNSISPTCRMANLVVDTEADVVDDNDGNLSLREALEQAAASNTVNHIAFAVTEVVVADGPLPPLPRFTYLDGGSGVRLLPAQPGNIATGITIDGDAVAVSGLSITGFGTGVLVKGGSRDVHLFRLRVGDPDMPNGTGIVIEGGCQKVYLGRGRELECIDQVRVPLPATGLEDPSALFMDQYDINVVVANLGDGIQATGVDELYIYGTWVGFDNISDGGYDDLSWGNGGIGIHLGDVTNAVIGAQRLELDEIAGQYDPLPAFVGVGRNRGGGVAISGGGNIYMPGLMLGDTPNMNPYGENDVFNLLVERNEGPVFYGPHPLADGPEARYLGLVYSEFAIPIQVVENRDLVWIRGVQNECFAFMHGCHTTGLKIQNPRAPIRLHHTTFIGDFQYPPLFLEGNADGNFALEVINNLFYRESASGQAVVSAPDELGAGVSLLSNMGYFYGGWCEGACQNPGADSNFMVDPPFGCTSDLAVPLAPDCPNVDAGMTIAVTDEQGDTRPMNLTGIPGTYHHGCAPDIGAFECNTLECLNVSCD